MSKWTRERRIDRNNKLLSIWTKSSDMKRQIALHTAISVTEANESEPYPTPTNVIKYSPSFGESSTKSTFPKSKNLI